MRILFVIENCSYPEDPRVLKEATALRSAGHQVAVICPARGQQRWRELCDGVRVYRFGCFTGSSRFAYVLEYSFAMLAILLLSIVAWAKDGFDILHVGNPPDILVPILFIYRLFGKRIIYDQHDLCPDLCAAKFVDVESSVIGLLHWLERRSYQLSDHVIVTNESYRQNALARGGIADSKVTVVRNGPDPSKVTSEIDAELRSKSTNLLFYSGRISGQDGLDVLCGVLQRLRYQLGRREFCCVIVGDGDALPEIKRLFAEAALGDNVYFTGWIDDPKTYCRYLNTADICVSPEPLSDYNDRSTFIKVMEYMSAAKPIVAFDLAETRFTAGDAALYARASDEREFATKLVRLIDDPALCLTMGEFGRARILEKFAWQYSVPRLLDAYNRCLPASPRNVPVTLADKQQRTMKNPE